MKKVSLKLKKANSAFIAQDKSILGKGESQGDKMGLIKGTIKLAIVGGLVYYVATYGCNALKKADYSIRNKAPEEISKIYDLTVEKGEKITEDLLKKGKDKLIDKIEGAYDGIYEKNRSSNTR